MGEVSPAKVGGPKPRPLGLIKRESVHFEDLDTGGQTAFPGAEIIDPQAAQGYCLLGRSKTDTSLRHDLKSMRDLQETLRQAALLNIVAAVNHEGKPPSDNILPTRSQSVGVKNLLGPPATPVITGKHSPGDYHFSRHLQTAGSFNNMPNSALTQLLSARPRSISIPRPRTHEQGSFMHNTLLDAKEQLTNMTNFRGRPRQDMASSLSPADETPHGKTVEIDTPFPPATSHKGFRSVDYSKTPGGHRVVGSDVGHHVSFSFTEKPEQTLECPPPTRQVPREQEESNRMSKEEQRAHNVQQMQMLKRHITTNKKRELVKRLTEIAKCEAVDMNEAIDSGPIIISSQPKSSLHATHPLPRATEFFTNGAPLRPASSRSMPREEPGRAPSNSRVQSETLEAMAHYRESRRKGSFQAGEDLKIEAIPGSIDRSPYETTVYSSPVDAAYPFTDPSYPNPNDVSTWLRENQFDEAIVGRPVQPQTQSPEVLELRPVEGSSPQGNKIVLADRRRAVIIRRSLNPVIRDKMMSSPSPMVYEATYHRPKASMGHIALVGQSLPSLSICKPSTFSTKGARKGQETSSRPPSQAHTSMEPSVRVWNEGSERVSRQTLKPWGSTAKPTTSSSPIFKTEILDHLQCKGIMDKRPTVLNHKKSISRIKGHNKAPGDQESEDDFDVDEEVGAETANKPANYRKSKLYSAFRASEENLATLADTSSLVSDTLTARSLMHHSGGPLAHARSEGDLMPDPVQMSHKEPRYMGCSSRVSQGEGRSQFHVVSGQDEDTKRGENFRVFKALDQDVYFDYQHRKYRGPAAASLSPLNTGTNKPRMHFLKIKYSGEAQS